MIDDDRYPLQDGETPEIAASGSAPSAATRSPRPSSRTPTTSTTLIEEMLVDRRSERSGRLIDGEGGGSMESKKTEGYF